MADEHPVARQAVEADPGLGAGDESACLPGWIRTFCEKFEAGRGMTLSPAAVRNLLHTLIAARQRARRLATERDNAVALRTANRGDRCSDTS